MNPYLQLIQSFVSDHSSLFVPLLGFSLIVGTILLMNRDAKKQVRRWNSSEHQSCSSESGTTQSQKTCSCKDCKHFRKTLKSGHPQFKEDTFITTLLGQRPGDILKELSNTLPTPRQSSTRRVTMKFSQLPKKPSSKIKLSTVMKASSKSTGRTSKQSETKANG